LAKGAWKFLLYVISAVLIFLGIIFIISTNLGIQYFFEGTVFIGVAIVILYFSRETKTIEIKKTVELSGVPKVKEIQCPNCGAKQKITKSLEDFFPYQKCAVCKQPFYVNKDLTARKLTAEEKDMPQAWVQIVEDISKKKLAITFKLE